MEDPYAFLEDGTPKDPAAFQAALKADPEKLKVIEEDPETAKVLLGTDMQAFSNLVRKVYQAEKQRMERKARRMAERSIDAQRASATVPRDTVQLYKQLHATGLQYGPAFRLLRNVHVPDTTGM